MLTSPLHTYSALRKTSHILSAISKKIPTQSSPTQATYYALDLERRELERTLDQLVASPVGSEMKGKIDVRGLWGTYEGGIKFVEEGGLRGREVATATSTRARSLSSDGAATELSSPTSSQQGTIETPPSTPDRETLDSPLHILFFGSSLGSFSRGEDSAFLKSLPLRADKGDTLLLGLDHTSDAAKIERAYNDRAGIIGRFVLNGLKVLGRTLGDESLFPPEKWEYASRYDAQERESACMSRFLRARILKKIIRSGLDRHDASCRSRFAQTVRDPHTQVDFEFLEDELIHIAMSHKVSFFTYTMDSD